MKAEFIGLKVTKAEKIIISKLLKDIKKKTFRDNSVIIATALQLYKAELK